MAIESNSEGGWPGGWLFAVVAGVIAAILARWIGDVTMAAAVLAGMFVFLVFGVLLGMFWTAPPGADKMQVGHQDHRHGGHGHAGDDHGDHSHAHHSATEVAEVASVPVAPVATLAVAAVSVAPVEPEPASAVQAVTPVAEPVAIAATEAMPAALSGPRDGKADKLQTIEGMGPAMEKLCHALGIYHFDQIASWGAGEIAWMDNNLKGFKGRVTRDKWVRQAELIVEVGTVKFLRRAKTNEY